MEAIRAETTEANKYTEWPLASCYFDPLIMDATSIKDLLSGDTMYASTAEPWCMNYTYIQDGVPYSCTTQATDAHDKGVFSSSVLTSHLTLIHVRQNRVYSNQDISSSISVDALMWLALLQLFEVLPIFLELLHNKMVVR